MKRILAHQDDRWLDSLWIINLTYKTIRKCERKTLKEYQEAIDNQDNKNWLCIMHHRKASIWAIKIANAHPFWTNKFALIQNGTSKAFMRIHWDKYWKETDSETMLYYLEEHCKNLMDVIVKLEEITDKIWIIIMVDTIHKNVLIYSDWERESVIDIQNWLLKNYTNYPDNKYTGFKNKGSIIIDYEWKILYKDLKESINSVPFITPYIQPVKQTKQIYRSSCDYGRSQWQGYLLNNNSKSKETVKPTDLEMFNSWLSEETLLLLYHWGVTEYDQLFESTELDLVMIDWFTQINLEEVKQMLKDWSMALAPMDDEDIQAKDMFETEAEQEEAYMNKIAHTLRDEPKPYQYMPKESDEYFYSEEILKDDWLLFSDILCYLYRTDQWTLKWYAYQNMWIPHTRAIKRVVGKATYRKMKRMFKAAWNKAFNTNTQTQW